MSSCSEPNGDAPGVWTFTVPGPPRGKGRPRFGRTKQGRPVTFTDGETRSYEALVAVQAWAALPRAMLAPPLGVAIELVLPLPKSRKKEAGAVAVCKPDTDNAAKAILDGLKAHLRDEHVAQLIASKRYANVAEQPHAVVRI